MEAELRAVERLLAEHATQLDQLRSSHAALERSFSALRARQQTQSETPARAAQALVKSPQHNGDQHGDRSPGAASSEASAATPQRSKVPAAPVTPDKERPVPSSHGGLDNRTMQVLTAAHERGYALRDLPGLPETEWEKLGATAEDKRILLGAVDEWRRGVLDDLPAFNDEAPQLAGQDPAAELIMGENRKIQGHARGDAFGEDGLENGIGHGKRHIPVADHIVPSTTTAPEPVVGSPRCPRGISGYKKGHGWPPEGHLFGGGVHARGEDDGVEGGLDRCVGHGRHYIGAADHIRGGSTTADGAVRDDAPLGTRARYPGRRYIGGKDHFWTGSDDAPGAHGHLKDMDYQEGLARCIGHGRRHFSSQPEDHIEHGFVMGDPPGAHGHSKDDDYEGGGLPRGIGHGKRHLKSGLNACIGAVGDGDDGFALHPHKGPNGSAVKTLGEECAGLTHGHTSAGRRVVVRSPSAPAPRSTQASPPQRPAGLPSRYAVGVGSTTTAVEDNLWRQARRPIWT